MKVGDLLLVTGPAFFEKTSIKSKEKGVYILENGIKIDRYLTPLNSKYQVEKFDDEKYRLLKAKRIVNQGLEKISILVKEGISDEDTIFLAGKVKRILKRIK